jgi:hypothetical protein
MNIPVWIIVLAVGAFFTLKGFLYRSKGIGDLCGLFFLIVGAIILLGLGLFYTGMYFGSIK